MPKQKSLLFLYFIILFLDVLGVIFPEWIDRKYTTFLPIPILSLLYVLSVRKINWLYIVALFFTYLGIVFFNIHSYVKLALIFYGFGVLIYVLISLKTTAIISIKSISIAAIPFLILYLVPLILYSNALKADIFNYIMFYVFFVGLFFFISILAYINQRSKANSWLFCSGILFVISTIAQGYNLFFGYITILKVVVILTFLTMHFSMYKYVSKK